MPNNNKRRFNAKHDNILMYSKGKDYVFNWQSVLTENIQKVVKSVENMVAIQ